MPRLWLRFCMYCLYPVYLAWQVLVAPRKALFVVTSNTFYAPMIAAAIGKLCGKRCVHLLWDLFPDVLEAAGQVRLNGIRSKLIGSIIRATQTLCSGTAYLGSFLKAHAERRWGAAKYSICVAVPSDASRFLEPVLFQPGSPLRIRYGGHFGYMHDTRSVAASIRAAASGCLPTPPVSFHFFISGVGYSALKNELAPFGIEVNLPIQDGDWRATFREYPIGMVSLSPGGAAVCLPSKIYGMMAGGQAVIAICPIWSDLARIVLENKAGWVINNSPYHSSADLEGPDYLQRVHAVREPQEVADEFVGMIRHLQENPNDVAEKQKNTRDAALTRYGREAIAKQWRQMIEHTQ